RMSDAAGRRKPLAAGNSRRSRRPAGAALSRIVRWRGTCFPAFGTRPCPDWRQLPERIRMPENFAIVVFSHLRWDFVFQRPQHLLSGLAQHHRVLFIEEPVLSESSQPEWQLQETAPNVTVCRPATPVRQPGFHEEQLP